jgi:hypothetical protein
MRTFVSVNPCSLHDLVEATGWLPNDDEEQIAEVSSAPDQVPLSDEEVSRIQKLVDANFGLEPEEAKFKGTMVLPEEATA